MKGRKAPLSDISPQFIVDKEGNKTAVLIDIKSYESLLDEIEDIYLASLAKETFDQDDLISHEEVKRKLLK